jgi:ABC-2 type transport system ATP-binding protein
MRQRILLIAALLHDPSLLILDEPLSGLDVTSAMIVKNLVTTLGERGKAILYYSHVLEVVEKICSQVIVLRRGKTIAYGRPTELMKAAGQASLEHAFAHIVEGGDATQTARDIASVMSA